VTARPASGATTSEDPIASPEPPGRPLSSVNAVLLAGVRADIDRIDAELVRLLAERHRLVLAAARLKGERFVPPSRARQMDILALVDAHADTHGLPNDLARGAFQGLFTALEQHAGEGSA